MSQFFRRNIKRHGRIARGVVGSLTLIAGIITVDYPLWLGLVFVATIAALIPANRAARMTVVDALRHA